MNFVPQEFHAQAEISSRTRELFAAYLKGLFPARTIFDDNHGFEYTKDRNKIYAGFRVVGWRYNYLDTSVWVTITEAPLHFKLRRRVSRDPIRYEWDHRIIKDTTWVDDMRSFSASHPRGRLIESVDCTLKIVDVNRSTHSGRNFGHNDEFEIERVFK
jgi:hypothetical protein